MSEPLQPVDFDRDTGGFFEAAKRGELVYRRCGDCGCGVHPPAQHCRRCGSANTAWQPASGRGTLYTWTTVMRTMHPAYPAPYAVVVVALEDAPEVRLVGRIDGEPELQAGQPMEVFFAAQGEGQLLPQWRAVACGA